MYFKYFCLKYLTVFEILRKYFPSRVWQKVRSKSTQKHILLYRPRLGPSGSRQYHFVKKVLSVATFHIYLVYVLSHTT